MNQNITIKDIAKKYKCSPSTVSRALNNNPLINIETRKTIQEYAEKMGYQKNTISLSLLNKSTKTIGVIVPDISHSHESLMIEGIQSVINPLGYMLIFCISNESIQKEKDHIERLVANRVDAIFVSVSHETSKTNDFEHFEKIRKRNIPLIFIDRDSNDNSSISFTIDDFEGAYQATKHLIDIGCKNIAHIKGPDEIKVSELRLQGYLKCLKDHAFDIREEFIQKADFNIESALKPTQALFKSKILPDGIFGVNDYVCYGVMQVLREKRLKIPENVAIVGFDNCPISSYFQPSLSTIDRKSFEIGALAANQLVKVLISEDHSQVIHKTVLNPELIKRETTAKLKF